MIGAGAHRARTFHLANFNKAIELNLMRAGMRITAGAQLGRLIALLTAVLLAAMPASAAEQFTPISRPPTYPVVLEQIKLITETTSESKFELSFDPTATTFTPALGRPDQPGIGFASTTRGPHAVQPSGLKGLVRSLLFDQEGDLLIVRFNAVAAAGFSAVQTGQRTIEVTISSGAVAVKKSDETVYGPPPGPLPPAAEPPPGEDNYELVLLKYADVSEVVGLLTDGVTVKSNDVFVPREPGFGSNSLTGNQYQPQQATQAPGSSDEPLGQSVDASMAIDRRLNAIWLRGSPDRIARMKAMIAMIDIPLDSVVLETQMVELTETGSKALGIDFTNANGQIGVVTFQSGQYIPPGVPAGEHLTSAAFQAALYAQISKGNGRIISKPRIAAQSGSTAKIITGDALPILTAITLSGVNGVSQQVQYVNVGVTLQIAPRVSADGYVSSHVYCVVSSVTGFSQGYPTISQRQAETAATVRDGDSFVIGGLTQDENITTRTKVPLLGDIPLVGQAFRTDKQTRSKTELYIIVTPHIVHRVGTMALSVPRQETYESRPVATVPASAPQHREP
jgi:general secretion pathway protein D